MSGRVWRLQVPADGGGSAVDFLAAGSGLSKGAVKEAMVKGAVWLRRSPGGRKRLRRATTELRPGDRLELFHDPALLARDGPPPRLVADRGRYSVWFKPAGLLTQGTDYGDHCALERLAAQALRPRPVLPVHRLDRETAGLMLLAHDSAAAARLSALLAGQGVEKRYRAQLRGDVAARLGSAGVIDAPLDDRPARTEFRVLGYDAAADVSEVDVRLVTGRLHQIRRHFADAGHPVMGDPRYGSHNKNREGLRLLAWRLAFRCPFAGRDEQFEVAVG